jgi:hypothetical protein
LKKNSLGYLVSSNVKSSFLFIWSKSDQTVSKGI